MATDELIDDHVSLNQCRLAVDALHSYESKRQKKLEETELISAKEPNIWLNITVKKIPPGHRIKPVKVPIAYPLVDPRTSPICLITKDPQREYKDLLESHNIKFISRVVGIEKLKGKFKPYEARRALLKENGMFLADERVVPLLPKLLGKKWFDAKKQPIPVCLKRKDLKGELERSISSTYMNQNQGTCTSVKIATLSQKPAQVLANLQKALPTIVANIKDGWENIQSLHIKTNSSVSLPIWSCSLDSSEEGRWHNLEAEAASGSDDDSEGGSDSMTVDTPAKKKSVAKAGRKRGSDSDKDMEEDVPRKRAKKETSVPSTKKRSTASVTSSTTPAGPSTKSKTQTNASSTVEAAPQPTGSKKGKTKSKDEVVALTPTPAKEAKNKTANAPSSKPEKPNAIPKSTANTSKELKAKRDAISGEKKKEKVVKQKLGKTAKSELLGKKAAQS